MKRRYPRIVSFLGAVVLLVAFAGVLYGLSSAFKPVANTDAERQAWCIAHTPGTADYVLQWCSDSYNWPAP
jgi:hypothetical protein